jgi:hypothetical protein
VRSSRCIDAVDVRRGRHRRTILHRDELLQRRIVDQLEDVPRTQRLARHRPELALLLGGRLGAALKNDLGHITSVEVLKKLFELTHDSNDIVKIYCESNYNRPGLRDKTGLPCGWNLGKIVRLTGRGDGC